MATERIDPETLAAFLDGRLEGAERERVLRFIVENPEEFETFADAAHVAAQMQGGPATVIPIGRATRKASWWRTALPALIAAGIAAVVVVPLLRGGSGITPADLAGRLTVVTVPGDGSLVKRLGENWDQPGWSVTRGESPDVVEPARAFRLGARATDVEIAARAQDSTALRLVGTDLVDLVSGVDAGAPAAALYRAIVDAGTTGRPGDRKEAAEALRALMGESPWFDLGAWTEASRVALAAGEPEFVSNHRDELRKLIVHLEARPVTESGEVVALLRDLETQLGARQPEAVKSQLNKVIVAAGR